MMKRRSWIIIVGCLFGCLGALAILYAFSPLNKEIYRASFTRKFITEPAIVQKGVLDIEYNSFYIAGKTKDKIFLGNSTAPFHLLTVSKHLKDTQHIRLKVKLDKIIEPRRFRLVVDSPYFFLSHGTLPKILRGNTKYWEAESIMQDSGYYFVESVPISSSTFAFRSYSLSNKGYELGKKMTIDPYFRYNYELLNKQIDGAFCLDGKLHYSKSLKQLIYIHFYRNEIIVADSNLNLMFRSHTLDTFSHARIKVAQIGSRNESMLSTPPLVINGISCVSDKFLFIKSNLLAKNEQIENFKNRSTIDVYDITNGSYVSSFYIPNYQKKRVSDIQVYENRLIAIFDHYLVLYDLNSEIFRKIEDNI